VPARRRRRAPPPLVAQRSPVHVTATAVGVLAGVRLGTGAIYLIAAVPLVIAALIASVIWRSAKRERLSRALRSRLESPNPQTRREALDKVTDEVLSIHAVMLSELLVRETDPDVLEALAAAVARSKWEPTDDAALVELRRWVAGGETPTTSSSNGVAPPQERSPAAPAGSAAAPGVAVADVPVEPAAGGAATPSAGTSTNGRESVPSPASPDVAEHGDGLGDLVEKVREVLGDGVERVEMVSIEGELLTSWSSAQHDKRRCVGSGAEEQTWQVLERVGVGVLVVAGARRACCATEDDRHRRDGLGCSREQRHRREPCLVGRRGGGRRRDRRP
jgi:hypothetical protein